MQEGGFLEVCHCEASVGSAILSGLDGTRVLDRANRPIQLKVKEALHIERIPANTRLNHDRGYELLGCWIATTKKLLAWKRGGANQTSADHVGVSASTSARKQNTSIFTPYFTFALKMTRASSWNVSKLYTEHQILHKESMLFLYTYCNWGVILHTELYQLLDHWQTWCTLLQIVRHTQKSIASTFTAVWFSVFMIVMSGQNLTMAG